MQKGVIHTDYYNWAKKLLSENNHTEILAAVLNYSFEEALSPESYGTVEDLNTRGKKLDQQGKTRLFVAMGKKDKINAKKLVDLVLSKVKMKAKDISDIQIMDSFSFMTVPFEKAEKIVLSFQKKRGRSLISHVKKSKKKKRKKKK